MKHLKPYKVFESGLTTERLKKEEIVSIIKENCKSFINYIGYSTDYEPIKMGLIFRKANRDYGQYGAYINPLKAESKRIAPWSRQNWHNILVSNLESWKEYPKRNKSLIGSGFNRANNHSGEDLYMMIPYDNSIMGVCPDWDFWSSFNSLSYNEGNKIRKWGINDWVESIIGKVIDANPKKTEPMESNWKDLKYMLTQLEYPREITYKKYFDNFDSSKTLLENMNKQISPENNGFKLLPIQKVYGSESNKGNEVWTEGECILVKERYINEILTMLQE